MHRRFGPLRVGAALILAAVVVIVAIHQWEDVRDTLGRISPLELAAAEALVLAGLAASIMAWRSALRELGSQVPVATASKIYLVGQLAKYLPGSFWVLPAQMELATVAGVPRVRTLATSMVAIGVNVVTGLALGLLVVPSVVSGGTVRLLALAAVLVVCVTVLSPPVLTRALDLGLRVVRRPRLEKNVSWAGILRTSSWSLSSWMCYGLSLWVLVVAVGAPAAKSLPLCLAGMALAMVLGFFVFFAPSGTAVREAVIVAALSPVLAGPRALGVALAARLVFTVADLLAAAATTPIRIVGADPEPPRSPVFMESSDEVDAEALNDRLAREYPIDDYYARSPWLIRLVERRRFAIIRRFMGNVEGLDVAEIGSGGGHVLRMFPGARLTAIDVSGEYLAIARDNLVGFEVQFLKGEVDKMSLPAQSFDRIICTEVLEHVVDPQAVLSEIARLLRPTGIAVVTVPNDALILRLKNVIQRRPFRWLAIGSIDWGGTMYHLHHWTQKEFRTLLNEHLVVVEHTGAPLGILPVRACLKCTAPAERLSND